MMSSQAKMVGETEASCYNWPDIGNDDEQPGEDGRGDRG